MRSRGHEEVARSKMLCAVDYKELLDEVFVISGIIKVEVSVGRGKCKCKCFLLGR